MKLLIFENKGIDNLASGLLALSDYNSILILSCEQNNDKKEDLDSLLKKVKANVCGGIFPGLIANNKSLDFGYILLGTNENLIVDTYDNGETKFINRDGMKTAFMFIDGLAPRSEEMLEEVFDFYGYGLGYVGGGAGRLSFEKKYCIFTNEGMRENCTQIAFSSSSSGIGVSHGFKPIGPSLRVTSSSKNVIKTLNYKPAFDVYQEVLKEYSGIMVTKENFLNAANKHPFGISKLGGDFVVRDPLQSDGNTVSCIGDVPENSFVHILTAGLEDLLLAAENAVKICKENKGGDNNIRFVVDCVSRFLHMGENYQKELNILTKGQNSIGILSIGEIANRGSESVELYNKTCVVSEIKGK